MTNQIAPKSISGRSKPFAAARPLLVLWPIALGLVTIEMRAQPPLPPSFEVVSVKPYKSVNGGRGGGLSDPTFLPGGRFTSKAPLIMVIAAAYSVPFFGPAARLSGGPAWINSPDLVYDIEATPSVAAASMRLTAAQRRQMLQRLLADRFKLVVRREMKEMPVYVLTVDKGGPKLPQADIQEKDCPEGPPPSAPADGEKICHRFNGGRGRGLHARAVDTSDLVNFVQNWTDRPIFDETSLKGLYRIDTEPWRPMDLDATRTSVDGANVADLPTLFKVFERLGLKMAAQKRSVDTYVIDHVEKPPQN